VKVPLLDVGATYLELRDEIDAAVQRVLSRGWFIGGAELERFERAFASYTHARHVVGVGNGLDAIRLALLAVGVGPGDEVVVPAHTFIATWLAVSQCGAVPVAVDIDESTALLDVGLIDAAITPRTRAIVPVDLYGLPFDVEALRASLGDRAIAVVEDAAQAHGATIRGHAIGAASELVAYSFYPGKNLGAFGDGGAIATNDPSLAARVRSLGNYGSSAKYVHDEPGMNSRLDPIQAAILDVKLSRLDAWNSRRGAIAARYRAAFEPLDLTLFACPDDRVSSNHLFVVRVRERDSFRDRLAERGIETGIHYPIPPHRQKAYATSAHRVVSASNAERVADEVTSLPIGPHLGDDDVDRVIDAVRSALR